MIIPKQKTEQSQAGLLNYHKQIETSLHREQGYDPGAG